MDAGEWTQTQWYLCKLPLPRGAKPLAADGNILYLYRRGAVIRYSLADHACDTLAQLASPSWKDQSRLLVRLLRREPRTAVYYKGILVLVWNKCVYTVDVRTGKAEQVHQARPGFSDPLRLCLPAEGDSTVYWGEYGSNREHADVRIYGLREDGTVDVVYTFPQNSVRHIHAILPDGKDGYYIFTGDNEPDAGIYHADPAFSQVLPVACGKQQYRAVVGFSTEHGLLYATDAVNEPNYIYLRKADGTKHTIAPLNGSCIYGGRYKDGYLFSTTVEPDERNRGFFSWFSYRRGEGILSDSVQLVFVDQQMRPSVVTEMRKDRFPIKLMQYGCIQFAEGADGRVFLYPVAVRKNDGTPFSLQADR